MLYIWPALALLVTGLFLKPLAALIAGAWLKFGKCIGNVSNRIILTLIFIVILTPIALLFRLFNKNPLGIRRDAGRDSYYHERNHTFTADDLEKMG
jgi:hypothetical protein